MKNNISYLITPRQVQIFVLIILFKKYFLKKMRIKFIITTVYIENTITYYPDENMFSF